MSADVIAALANLHADVSEAMLLEKFASAGPIFSAQMYSSAMCSEPTRIAEVRFQQAADGQTFSTLALVSTFFSFLAIKAMNTMNGDTLHGRELYIISRPNFLTLSHSYLMHVFISSLDKMIDKRSLHETFSAFGMISSCEVMK